MKTLLAICVGLAIFAACSGGTDHTFVDYSTDAGADAEAEPDVITPAQADDAKDAGTD